MSGIPHDHYEPKTGAEKWLERAAADRSACSIRTLMIPTPKNLNWMWIWGIVLTFCLVDADRHRHRAGDALHPAHRPGLRLASSTSCAT